MFEPKDISKIRRQLGLTQSRLADISGVSQSLIAKIEAGKLDPSFSKYKSIVEALLKLQRKDIKKAQDIMSREIVYVTKGEGLDKAARLMREHAVSQLPIYDGTRVVGSISEKTILRLLSESGNPEEVFRKQIKGAMDEPFPTVSEQSPVEVLYPLLEFFQAVLVVREGIPVGIVTKADLLKV